MDGYEATRIVFSRIQKLDPDNASRIMGLLLIQDHGEKEMIRLAFGPEALVHSVILRVRKELSLSSNSPPTPSTPLSPSPFFSRQSSSRLLAGNIPPAISIPNPSSAPDDHFYDVMDELQLQEQLSFLNDGSSPPLARKGPDFYYPNPELSLSPGGGWGGHRRSCSVSDEDDPGAGFGWKPCLYFARGYCKNGTACRFLHGEPDAVGSPEMMVEHELLRSKSAHQHRLTASAFPYSPKTINLLLDPQRAVGAALLSGEELQKLWRSNLGIVNPASRQIYLTFPADSTFREEDVSNYFSIYGPVQDVRIPYQQKRMFGFVTFLYPETVKLILAKGNPHFVCDARVLVKPYKEKAKVLDHKKQMERGDFSSSPCGTPTSGLDSRDLYELPLSPGGMLYSSAQDMLWRRKLEEQALEIQSRRLMNLQLLDVKKHHHHHRAFSTGSPTTALFSPRHMHQLNGVGKESPLDEDSNGQQQQSSSDHNLPDSPFASPTKAEKDATTNTNSSSSSLDMASFKSFNCQIPRFSSGHGHGVIGGMFAGTGGSTFPVGI